MKQLLTFVAVIEAATGLALIIAPSLVGRLLLGAESTGVAIPVARVLGIALIGLGVTCWPGPPLIGHVNLQRGCHVVSSLSRHRRRMGRSTSMAGSCVACSPDAASRAGLVQAIRRQSSITKSRSCLVVLFYPFSHATRQVLCGLSDAVGPPAWCENERRDGLAGGY